MAKRAVDAAARRADGESIAVPVNRSIHPDLYRQLMAMENIDYIKDSTGDLIRLQKLIGIGGHVLA